LSKLPIIYIVTDISEKINLTYKLEIEFNNELELEKIYHEFEAKGYKCRILTL
jgi:hypothetical protein